MASAMPAADANNELLIMLEECGPRTFSVRAVELSLSAVKVRFTAADAARIDQVFQGELADVVRSICEGAAHVPDRIEQPDFCLRLRGLVLQGYAISSSLSETGLRRMQLRIDQAIGNALAAFRLSARSDTGLALFTPRILSGPDCGLGSDRLFDEMLSQLYLPLVNLNAYLRHVLDGSTPGRDESLSNSVVQLKTRAETLQFAFDRLIAEKMVDRIATLPDGPARQLDTSAA